MSPADPWVQESERQASGGFGEVREMTVKDNTTHTIRILPGIKLAGKEEAELPFHGYVIHWIPQMNAKKGKPIIHELKKRCGVCNYIHDLWSEVNRIKEEEDLNDEHPRVKAIKEKITAVNGKEKYDFNIFDRDEMVLKVKDKKIIAAKRFTTPWAIWKAVFDYAKNPKWGSPSDEKTGYDLDIAVEGEGSRRQYSLTADRDASPLTAEEIEALKTRYDLKKLRPSTTLKDIKEFLKNAKPPFNDILSYFSDNEEDAAADEKPAARKAAKQEPTRQPEPEPEAQEPEVEETAPEPETKAPAAAASEPAADTGAGDTEDPNNINSYECKGEFEESQELCRECPVKTDCTTFQPIYEKAKTLKIDVTASRSVQQITEDVKKTEPADAKPKLGKGKRQMPF